MKLEHREYFDKSELTTPARRALAVKIMRESGVNQKHLDVTDEQIKAAGALVFLRTEDAVHMFLWPIGGQKFLLGTPVKIPVERLVESEDSVYLDLLREIHTRIGDVLR